MENEDYLLDYKKGSPITLRMKNGEKITGVLRHKPMKYKLKIFGVVIFPVPDKDKFDPNTIS